MPRLPPAHHKVSKRDSPNETKVKEKQNKTIPDSNSTLAKSMTHHNQTKKWTTWFLILIGSHDEISHNSSLSQGSISDPSCDKDNSAVCSTILCS
jgi:hypothetical protein